MPELRLALRLLRQQPVVTFTTLLALTIGIGMATTGFTLLDAVLHSKLPFANGDRFVLFDVYSQPEARRDGLDAERFRLFSEQAPGFVHVGAFRSTVANLQLASGEVVPINGTTITGGSFSVLPYTPLFGRTLHAGDSRPGAEAVVLLRESLWRRHFSGDPQAIGSIATISGVRRTIVGVMPDTAAFPGSREIWLPLTDPAQSAAPTFTRTFGVLREGVSPEAAGAQIEILSKQVEGANPAAPRLRIVAMEFTAALSQGLGLANLLLVTCLALVLTVIAANIGNLVFARTIARARELAVRTALGATRARLVGQVFAEVAIVGVVAAAIGLAASQTALAWTRNTMTEMPFWVTFSASPRTMVFVVCATLLTACVGGVAPALRATRRDPAELLAATTRGASIGLGPMSSVLVTVQVALSIALLNSALLMARGVAGYMKPTIHVPVHEVLTARVVSETTAATAIEQTAAAMPGVAAAGVSSSLPGLSPPTRMTIVEPVAESAGPVGPRAAPVVAAGPGFFDTFGARLESGRLFNASDFAATAAPVAVVNRPFVDKFFGGHDPIGRRIRAVGADASQPAEPWREVVGVVPDLGLSAGDENLAAGYYVPIGREASFHVALRTSGDARRLSAPLRSALNDLDPQVQLRDLVSLDAVGREDRVVFAGIGAALAALGGIGLLLTVLGTYAILSLSVTRCTREIGVRQSLGATRRQVLQSVLGRTALPPAIGAVAGVALGQALVPMRSIFAFRLPDGSGPWGLPILGVIMVTAAVVAAWLPARRALAIDPAAALRSE